jgi:hypothetical protein
MLKFSIFPGGFLELYLLLYDGLLFDLILNHENGANVFPRKIG